MVAPSNRDADVFGAISHPARRHLRERPYRIVLERLSEVRDWLAGFERFWDDQLQRRQKAAFLKRPAMTKTVQEDRDASFHRA